MRAVFLMIWVVVGCASATTGGGDAQVGGTDGATRPDAPVGADCWIGETVDTGNETALDTTWSDLRVTDGGDVEVAYRLGWGARRTAHRGAGPWLFEDTSDTGSNSPQARALGADGTDHVCYMTQDFAHNRAGIDCAERSGAAAWITETIDQIDQYAGSFVTLATAPDGTAHLMYTDGSYIDDRGAAWHASKAPGAAWSTEPLGHAWGGYRPLAVDPAGCVHVAEVTPTGARWQVEHAVRCGGGAWQLEMAEQVDARPLLARHGIALGSGTVHILYHVAGTMHVARRSTDGTWSIDVVADDLPILEGIGGPAAIAADRDGGVVVTYAARSAAANDERIVLAIAADGARMRSSVGTATFVAGSDVTVDATGAVHAVFDSNDVDGGAYAYRLDYVHRCSGGPQP